MNATTDLDIALDLYAMVAAGGPDERLVHIVIPGAPPSKARHRFRRNGAAYMSPEDRAAEAATATHLRSVFDAPFTGNVAIGCVFFRPNRQRIDTDNLLKHVCDAATGIAWIDDSQVTAVFGRIEYDPTNPRTVLVVGNDQSTMLRGTDAWLPCVVCGSPVPMDSRSQRRTCSRECSARARGFEPLAELVPCAHCGKPFKRTTRAQRLCSPECRVESLRSKRKEAERPPSQCLDCGAELAHHRGGRCRDCWRINVAGGTS